MTKEEIIAKAYGIDYNKLKEYINNNGWCRSFPSTQNQIDYINTGLQNVAWRPKSLQGIENNNGWIKIESEKDLPITDVDCHIVYNNNLMSFAVWDNLLKGFYIGIVKQNPSHYQPIVKPLNPIY